MKKWIFRIAVVVIGLPVLIALILGGLMVAGVDILSFIPGEEWVTQWAVAYLEDNYGLILEYEDVSLDFWSGSVVITRARLLDASNRDAGPLLSADELSVRAVQQGETYTVDRVDGEGVSLPVAFGDASPPLLAVLERLAPADVHSMVAGVIDDVPNRYNGRTLTLQLAQAEFSQSRDSLELGGLSLGWSDNASPLLAVSKADVSPVMNSAAPLKVGVGSITLTAHSIGENRYDLTDLLEVIENMESAESSSGSTEGSPGIQLSPIPELRLALMDGSNRVAEFQTGSLTVNMDAPSISIANPVLRGGGNDILKTDRVQVAMSFDWALDSVNAGSPQVTLVEREDGSFNLTDALEELMIALNAAGSAGGSSEAAALPGMQLGNTNVTYALPDGRMIALSMGSMDLNGESGELSVSGLQANVDGVANPATMGISTLGGVYKPLSALTDWDSLSLDGVTLSGYFDTESMQPVETLTTLAALPTKIKTQLGLPVENTPIVIDDLSVKGQNITVTDRQKETPVDHVLGSVSLSWNDVQIGPDAPPMGDVALAIEVAEPSTGAIGYEGKLSPGTTPANADGTIAVTVDSVQGYEPYYAGQLPLELVSSGLDISGPVKIDNDQLTSEVDVRMVQPQFAVRENAGAFASLNQNVALTAINGIKNDEGDIVVQNNRVVGDLNNPEFKPGITLFDVLGKNILKFILNTPGLITDPLGTGQALMEGVGGAVGGILGGSAEGVGNLFQGLLGGSNRSATEEVAQPAGATGETQSATEEAEAPNPARDVGNALRSLFGGTRND